MTHALGSRGNLVKAAYMTERRELLALALEGMSNDESAPLFAEFDTEMLKRRKDRAAEVMNHRIAQQRAGLRTLQDQLDAVLALRELPHDLWGVEEVIDHATTTKARVRNEEEP